MGAFITKIVRLLKGSWDLVTRLIKVVLRATILIVTYIPNQGTYNLTY